MKNIVLVPSGTSWMTPWANLPISFATEVNHSSPLGPILWAEYHNSFPVIGSRGPPAVVLALCQYVCGALVAGDCRRLRKLGLLIVATKCFGWCLVLWLCGEYHDLGCFDCVTIGSVMLAFVTFVWLIMS